MGKIHTHRKRERKKKKEGKKGRKEERKKKSTNTTNVPTAHITNSQGTLLLFQPRHFLLC